MRSRLDRTLRLLILANILVVAVLAGTMILDWLRVIPARGTADGTNTAEVSASPDTMQMGLAHIPTSNSCLLCHERGGASELKAIPAIGHQLQGWTACLTCHTNDTLGRKAPGHEGIAETECLNCHKVARDGPAITQAHAQLSKPCLDCHGKIAHLPSSMVGRNQDECWLCHKPNPSPPPIKPHPDPQGLTCRSCHQSTEAGALPIDHALRGDDTCVLCHDVGDRAQPSPAITIGPSAKPAP
jgi:nitrate/TMAO reductase-like tetraheme cytochrome c subunit